MSRLTEEEILSIQYFWRDKEDLERIERTLKKCPALKKAWEDYKASRQLLTLVVDNLDQLMNEDEGS